MPWTKLDDTTVVADYPLSSFVGKRLYTNVNSYPSELSREATFAYPTTAAGEAKVKWASIFGSRGTVVTVDVGTNALRYTFSIQYKTTSASLGGTFRIHGIDDGYYVSMYVSGSATPTSVDIPYTSATPVSGLRGFFISWESEIGESVVGQIEPTGAVGNQVFCNSVGGGGGGYPFTLATGFHEMYHLLEVSATVTRPSPAGNSLRRYQVCGFTHYAAADQPPQGVLLVWPNVEVNPPIFSTDTTSGTTKMTANLFQLGRLELYSITVIVQGQPFGLLPPYSYQQTTPVNDLNNYINSSMMQLQPNAGSLLSNGGFLGRVLTAGEQATFAFFVQNVDVVLTLNVSFRAVAYNQAQDAPDITFGVRDSTGATVGTDITHTSVAVARMTGKTVMANQDGAAMYMNGVLAGDEKWGMRDAMNYREATSGYPIRFTWGPNLPGDLNEGYNGVTNAVYFGTITATSDLYIYGFNCKVL